MPLSNPFPLASKFKAKFHSKAKPRRLNKFCLYWENPINALRQYSAPEKILAMSPLQYSHDHDSTAAEA